MKTLTLTAILCAGLLGTSTVIADDDSKKVRQLVQEGKIMPLEELLATHRDKLQGRILDLEMETEHGRVIYEIKTLDAQGTVREVEIDAQTGEWLREKVKTTSK